VSGDNGGPARNTQDTQRGNVWNIYFFLSFVLYAFQMYRTSLVSAALLCDGNTKKFVFFFAERYLSISFIIRNDDDDDDNNKLREPRKKNRVMRYKYFSQEN
jgi:hypothetical protein